MIVDFDPEDSYTTYNNEKNNDQIDLDAGRSDYLQVGYVNSESTPLFVLSSIQRRFNFNFFRNLIFFLEKVN